MLSYLVAIPLLISVFLFIFSFAKAGRVVAILLQMVQVGYAIHIFWQSRTEAIYDVVGGYPSVLGIILRADAVSAAFVIVTAIIFLMASIYSFNEKQSKLYWFMMFIWQAMIVGLFLTRDFFNVFVLLEVSTVVVVVLIMYNRHSRAMYDGIIYLMVNIVAMQFYLFGLGYLYMLTGTLDMSTMRAHAQQLEPSQLILPLTLVVTGMAFKAALLPIFSWMPKVRAIPRTPSPVAAILSGLHVKTIIFILIQLFYVFPQVDMSAVMMTLGIVGAVGGIIFAIAQRDIKLILAYSSIAQVGLIMIGFSLSGEYAYYGSLYHMINHAIFKVALFLASGMIIEVYGTRDINKISGIFKKSPTLAVIILLAIGGIVGAPFFNGSMSKYFMMAQVDGPMFWVMTIINFGTITVFVRFATMLFGKPQDATKAKLDGCKVVTVGLLGLLSLGLGIGGVYSINFLKDPSLPLTIDTWGYIEKVIAFAISLVIAIVGYKLVLKKANLRPIERFDVSFKGICLSLGAFFAIILLVVGM